MKATERATPSSEATYLSYASPLVLRRLQRDTAVVAPEVELCTGAVALIDVERFSSFAERMSGRGSEGVEQLATRINDTFALVVEAIERHGGIAHSFPGDSVIALWIAEGRSEQAEGRSRQAEGRSHTDACVLAARCALELVEAHRESELPLKAGLAAGDMKIVHVGGIGGRLQLLLSGEPLDGMGRAEKRSSRGRLMATEAAWRLLAPHAMATVDSDGFYEVKSVRPALSSPPSPLPETWNVGTALAARAYLPAALLRQLDAGQNAWLGEFREVTTVFVLVRPPEGADAVVHLQEAFRTVQRAIDRHGGDVMRFAHDDKGLAVLAVFGLPPAPAEASAARALTAALQMIAEAPVLRFACRVGVATGRVFCGTLGAPGRREYSVVGSTPNLAARLMQHGARSGESGIVCDTMTMKATGDALSFESIGRLRLKGFPEPVEAFRPVRATDTVSRVSSAVEATSPIGREIERARLAAWVEGLRRALADERGAKAPLATEPGTASRACHLAVVQGEAGVGKSTLIREAALAASQAGLEVVRVACEAVQSTSTYASWSKALAALLDLERCPGRDERTARVRKALADAGVHTDVAPLVAPILDVDIAENETTREMSGPARADNVVAILARLVTHLSALSRERSGGLLLVLEDVHWLDPASWELLGVVTRAQDAGVLGVLATMRSETTPSSSHWQAIVTAPETERITLVPLSRSETEALAGRLLGANEVSPQLLQLTFDRTRGNPFFCEQLLSALSESGLAGVENGSANLRIRNPEQAESLVPRSVAAVVTSRLDRLPAPVQLTLKAASVIGARFRMDVLRAIHPMQLDEDTLQHHLTGAVELGLIEDAAGEPGTKCFQHAITCDVAYDLLLVSQRRQLHRDVAEYLGRTAHSSVGQSVLFYHWRRSGDEVRALEHVDHAGAEAMRNGDYHAVVEMYGYALQSLAGPGVRAATASARRDAPREAYWSAHLGQAQVAIGVHEEARPNLEMSLEMLGENARRGIIGLSGAIAGQLLRQLAHRLAPSRFEGTRARDAVRCELAVHTWEQFGFICYSAGDLLPGLYGALRMINLAELAGLPGLMARTHAMMGLTASAVRAQRIAEIYDRHALDLARESGDASVAAFVGWVTGIRATGDGRWDVVTMRVEPAERMAAQAGDLRLRTMCLTLLAWTHYARGELRRAMQIAEGQLATARESNNRLWEAWWLNGVAEPAVMLGDYETAARCCQRALAVLSQESDRAEEIRALGLLAVSHLRRSRPEEAQAAARSALDLVEDTQMSSFIMCEGLAGICEVMVELSEDAMKRMGAVPAALKRDTRRAERAFTRYSKIFPIGKPRLHTTRARLAMLDSSPSTAIAELGRAIRASEELAMPHAKGLALLAAARCPALDASTRRRRAEEAGDVLRDSEARRQARELLVELRS